MYAQTGLELVPDTLRTVVGVRADHVRNRVEALTPAADGGSSSDTQVAALAADRHVHPAEPRSARLTLAVRF